MPKDLLHKSVAHRGKTNCICRICHSCSVWADILRVCAILPFGTAGTNFSSFWAPFLLWTWPRWPWLVRLQVRANPRPLLLVNYPHGGWEKWSRICSNSKHSRDMNQSIDILAMLWVRANPRPLFPTAMGVLDSKKWPQISSNSKHIRDITIVTQLINILAQLWLIPNPRPLRPTNMGGPQSGTKVASDLL